MAAWFIPVALCMGLPLYLHQTVLEKEKRLLQFMRINGLKMESYWTVTYLFNFSVYLISYLVFHITGTFIFRQPLFVKTSLALQLITYLGWGLS
jgi:hypothetical protein